MSDEGWYRWDGDVLLLSLRVQPRSRKDQFTAPHGDHYKTQITAPPVDGKANEHLVRFLAESFGVKRSQISLQSGQTSRNKLFHIESPTKFPIPVRQRC
jgi:uncharacterized protein (TIGR00251 family)